MPPIHSAGHDTYSHIYRRDPYWSTSRGKGGLRLMIVLFTVFSVLLILACIKRTRGRSSNAPPRRGLTLPTSQQSPARTGWTIFLSGPPQDGRASSANVTRGLARPENAYYEGGHRMLDYTAPPPDPPPLPIDTQYPPPLYELGPQPPGYQERRT